jgi:hypothetical protein
MSERDDALNAIKAGIMTTIDGLVDQMVCGWTVIVTQGGGDYRRSYAYGPFGLDEAELAAALADEMGAIGSLVNSLLPPGVPGTTVEVLPLLRPEGP